MDLLKKDKEEIIRLSRRIAGVWKATSFEPEAILRTDVLYVPKMQ